MDRPLIRSEAHDRAIGLEVLGTVAASVDRKDCCDRDLCFPRKLFYLATLEQARKSSYGLHPAEV